MTTPDAGRVYCRFSQEDMCKLEYGHSGPHVTTHAETIRRLSEDNASLRNAHLGMGETIRRVTEENTRLAEEQRVGRYFPPDPCAEYLETIRRLEGEVARVKNAAGLDLVAMMKRAEAAEGLLREIAGLSILFDPAPFYHRVRSLLDEAHTKSPAIFTSTPATGEGA